MWCLTFDRRHTPRRAEAERGQSLVEMAFGLVILALMMAGLLDLGRAYFTYVALEDAAGEAALFLSIYPGCPDDGTDGFGNRTSDNGSAGPVAACDPPNNAMWRAERAGGGLIDWSSVVTVVAFVPTTSVGETVSVTLNYPFELVMPIIPEIAGAPTITLVSHASQTVIAEQRP